VVAIFGDDQASAPVLRPAVEMIANALDTEVQWLPFAPGLQTDRCEPGPHYS